MTAAGEPDARYDELVPHDGLSIVVPTYERPDRLERCLEALADMKPAGVPIEVIVVDDGSNEPPSRAVQAIAGRLDITLHSQQNAGPASARNTGASMARYRWLAFTDDDCTPDRDWGRAFVAALQDTPGALIGGTTRNAVHGNLYSDASQQLINALYRWQQSHPGQGFWTSNNMACSRAVYLELGGFDETFPLPAAEDRELGVRWQRSGRALANAPDAVVDHHHDLGMASFWRQHHNYGRGASRYRDVLAGHGDSVDMLPPAFYVSLLTEPFRHVGAPRALAISALIGLSQIATAAGFATERYT